jgi:hypothetical protein
MSRRLAIVFAALLAVNAVVGTVALTRTVHLGQAAHASSSTLVAKRTAQLDRFEASLHAQLAKKPPPLPKVPSGSASGGTTVSAGSGALAPRVRYVRPAPIVVHKHRAGGEYEHEGFDSESEGGADD